MRIATLLILVLLAPFAAGVIIEGSVYDMGLDPLSDAIVQINTSPAQKIVAKQGSYSFNVPPGDYILSASSKDLIAEENVSIAEGSSFTIDLILFPDFAETSFEDIPDIPEVESLIQSAPTPWYAWLLWLVFLSFLAYVVFRISRRHEEVKHVAVDDDLKRILKLIDEHCF